MKEKELAINISGVSKKYTLHHQKPTLLENIFKISKREEIWALKNINLEIIQGEKIGIIGNNGSGKTTLLKLISGITTPTAGNIQTNGIIASLLDLESGFHPELTGEENLLLNGLLNHLSKKEIIDKKKSILDYADIGSFIDAPFYTYSSGMKLRLGFSIAIHSNPDILLVDEILSVGDKRFQQKVHKSINNFLNQSKTVIYSSHNLVMISQMCDKTIWIDRGVIKMIGETHSVVRAYTLNK